MKEVRGDSFQGGLVFPIMQRAAMMARWVLVALAAR